MKKQSLPASCPPSPPLAIHTWHISDNSSIALYHYRTGPSPSHEPQYHAPSLPHHPTPTPLSVPTYPVLSIFQQSAVSYHNFVQSTHPPIHPPIHPASQLANIPNPHPPINGVSQPASLPSTETQQPTTSRVGGPPEMETRGPSAETITGVEMEQIVIVCSGLASFELELLSNLV